ncbi:MAG TPA: hypothetical protein VNM72_00165 [Blastocatellia bacterium]|nr:hypothetical protein [Blastocatellia bacterium]
MRKRHHLTHRTLVAAVLLILLVMSSSGSRRLVVAEAQAAPDVGFIPVEGPPFDSPDVWVDSPLNGYGTYLTPLASDRAPTFSGDPLWPGRVHRIYARVHNFGSRTASNLTVRFYVRQPAGISDDGFWQLVGTLQRFGPIQANSLREGFIEWTPLTDVPTSIKVEVSPLSDETVTANNSIIEASVLVTSGPTLDGGRAIDLAIHNPFDSTVEMFFEASVMPLGQSKDELVAAQAPAWQIVFDLATRRVRPGCGCLARVNLYPPNPCDVANGAPALINILPYAQEVGKPRVPLRGVTLLARSVKPAAMEMSCPTRPTSLRTQTRITGQLFESSCPLSNFDIVPLSASNQPITLEYRSPSGKITLHTVRTNTRGGFSDAFVPDESGIWNVRANWIGDSTHSLTVSVPCSVEVVGCPPPELFPVPDPITIGVGTTRELLLSVVNPHPGCGYTFSISPSLSFVTLSDHGDGTATLRISPARSNVGTHRLTITVRSNYSSLDSDSQIVTINVTP